MHPTREALERALAADPDDSALHGAYADYLIEQGDARGESIRLELALEDPELPPERQAAATRELAALWAAHRAEWLGPLAGRDDFQLHFEWLDGEPPSTAPGSFLALRRGWIDHAYISEWRPEFLTALTACPLFKLLRRLVLWSGSFAEDVSGDPSGAAKALAGFGDCRALRYLEWHADGSSLRPVLDAAARLEVLLPTTRGDELAAHLPRLRELHLRCYNGATRFRPSRPTARPLRSTD